MKAYVIKNKEGKYSEGEFDSNDNEIFTENLIDCEHYFEEVYAQTFCPKDCEVVEITIAEGDLEEENRILKKALELACEKIEFMAQMLGQTLDYNVEENFIEQAKGEKDE